jgi:hypothetical protein
MGIWDALGKAANKLNEYAGETIEEVEKYKEKYDRLSDRELIDASYKRNHHHIQIAITKLLGERGFVKGSDGKWR